MPKADSKKTAVATQEDKKAAARPKIFYTNDDRIEVVVTGFYSLTDGTLQFALPEAVEDKEESNFTVVRHVFRFSAPTYDNLCAYRQAATVKFEDSTGTVQLSIDDIRLNKYLWTYHLKDWNFTDDKGDKIPIVQTPDGTLSDESFKTLNSINVGVLDKAIAVFRRRLSIE